MPSVRKPRAGSLQFWPRRRSKRNSPRIRSKPLLKEKGLVGFAGYKVGMTHVSAIETSKHKKGEEHSIPVTVIECPAIKIAVVNFYNKTSGILKLKTQFVVKQKDSELSLKLKLPKKSKNLDNIKLDDYDDLCVIVYTQPKLTGIGKKKPDLFELALGGTLDEKLNFVRDNLDKDIIVDSVFKEGDMVDIKAITKGKGYQGPVKRFGITVRQKKSEKAIRNPGSLGPWEAQGKIMWRVAHAGKMGYHQRTEYNKQILKIIKEAQDITPKGGFIKYGQIKNKCILIAGSVPGTKKRLIIMQKAIRPRKSDLPTLK